MKIYISGPMTGHPDHNRAGFETAATRIREAGHEPLNPWRADLAHADPPLTWYECMMESLTLLGEAEAIMLLPGAEHSPGSRIEQAMAQRMRLTHFELTDHAPQEETSR
ncbi:DUF4406 domain-containing protein [Mobiluncus porci]|uniref:DUF4406 domain-containing protein n=1 Tax=Mobiluncus porci TaxID=2652278 RepID=A0A7K0K560_9ACTO|nr:DUF4406 domain-containing protein [Mobiluncus porci]MST50584.1 DUF4406 domain-containing protein [Mobiluncus porci]